MCMRIHEHSGVPFSRKILIFYQSYKYLPTCLTGLLCMLHKRKGAISCLFGLNTWRKKTKFQNFICLFIV